jgi:hypothetical protein
MQINSARSENVKQKIAGNLHGLLDQRLFKDMGRDPAAGGHQGPQRKDHSNGQTAEKVSPRPVQPEPGRVTHYEINVKFSGKEYKKSVTVGPDVEKPHKFLSRDAKGFALRVAAKHNISNLKAIVVNVNRVDQETAKYLQGYSSTNRARAPNIQDHEALSSWLVWVRK